MSKGHSFTSLAKAIGAHHTGLRLYEQCEMYPRLTMLHRICVELDVSADWLLGLED